MVNGPRPATIAKPATPATPASFTPASHAHGLPSPTLLHRQHTSIYSACSTGTPVLVYGKAATPVAGDWSAEPWDASRVRPMVLEAVLSSGADNEDMYEDVEDSSSVAETAAYSDASKQQQQQQNAYRPQAADTTSPTVSASAPHVAFIYRYDPYSSRSSKRELYRCVCDSCMDGATCGRDALTYVADIPSPSFGMEAFNSDEYTRTAEYEQHTETTSVAPETGYAGSHPMAYESAQYWAASSAVEAGVADPPTTSNFVPPPPPPKICRGVIAESAEHNLDVDAAFYHISMRWYTKVAAVQQRFVRDVADYCPEPEQPGTTFAQWIEAVGKWWLRHFENAQRKTSASSGLLRTAMAPVGARLASTGGFESHASVAASFAVHRLALKTGPRRQFGTSGLTAQMLDSHNTARLPTPRSVTKKTTDEVLPW